MQFRAIGVLLIGIGLVAMVVSMIMNWRFGYSLAASEGDRLLMAVLHSLVDPAAACLIAAGGLMLAWGWRWQGIAALLCAGVLVAYSMVTVFGFMSDRIGQLEGHKAALATQQGYLKWVQGQRVNMDIPKSERRLMREDVKTAVEKLSQSVRIIPDKHASAIAAATGFSVEAVQRGLVSIGSGIAQGIKFACLGFGFFLVGLRLDASASSVSSPKDDASGGGKKRIRLVDAGSDASDADRKTPAKSAMQAASAEYQTTQRRVPDVSLSAAPPSRMSDSELREYLRSHASGQSQRQIASATGWSQPSVSRKSRQVRRQEERVARKAARASSAEAVNMSGYPGFGGTHHAPAMG